MATINIGPCECCGSGSCRCPCCLGTGYWETLTLTVSGITDEGGCAACDDLNGTFTIEFIGPSINFQFCLYSSTETVDTSGCASPSDPPVAVAWAVQCIGGLWTANPVLDIPTEFSTVDTLCGEDGNTVTLVNPSPGVGGFGNCSYPATLTIETTSGFVACSVDQDCANYAGALEDTLFATFSGAINCVIELARVGATNVWENVGGGAGDGCDACDNNLLVTFECDGADFKMTIQFLTKTAIGPFTGVINSDQPLFIWNGDTTGLSANDDTCVGDFDVVVTI